MLIGEVIVKQNMIQNNVDGAVLDGLIPVNESEEIFENFKSEYLNKDLTAIKELYRNVDTFKFYGEIVIDASGVGIKAASDIMSQARNSNLNLNISILEDSGEEVIRIPDNVIAFMEEDDDDNPNTNWFYFVGRID